MKVDLRGKRIVHDVMDDGVSTDITDEALSLIISPLGNIPFIAVLCFSIADETLDELQIRPAGKILINKPVVLNGLLSVKCIKVQKNGVHPPEFEMNFLRLAAMNDKVLNLVELVILLFFAVKRTQICGHNCIRKDKEG